MAFEQNYVPDPSGDVPPDPTVNQGYDIGLCDNCDGSSGGAGLSGSGSPEGVITADPGVTYWDATNKVWYVKDTGTGSTGWQELIALPA
jgi:hypothetical protein